jgi:hypothetical protein
VLAQRAIAGGQLPDLGLLGRCPFHEDATASLVVTPGKARQAVRLPI